MPMPNDDRLEKITLLVGGHAYSDWKTYRIDSDFLKAADAWQLSLGITDGVFNVDAVRGAPVKVKMGDDVVLSGRIDTVTRDVSRKGITLSLSGRDEGGILIDCAAPVFSARQLNLSEVISSVVRPLGITRVRIQADNMIRSDRIQTEPGERAWDTVMKAAGSRGLWPWFAPDGTLIIGGPDYDKPPVADLILTRSGDGNNLISLSETRNIQGCFSELTLLAQSHASTTKNKKLQTKPVDVSRSAQTFRISTESDEDTGADDGQSGTHNMRIKIGDPSVPYYRPQIITAGDVDNPAQLQYRAKKAMADARLSGLDITAEVFGHRTDKGELWEPGQRVRIKSELHGIDGIFFLMGRTFTGGRPGGPVTQLRFKEDGVWIPDVYTQKAKNKKGKKKKGKDQIRPVALTADGGK
ncbi:TPA: phage baseplate assembly protein [Morganella morganii]|nr:phage tail protein [Morganella morganii]HDU8718208.1 phage tail protein [Morganella morganii subsp. morganii]EKU4304169.1 phage tail protein [Morganella morganii]EKU6426879.1 phage tail protein [Morganella morganii]ELA7729430.1 phage tail protein [Morganella morganii]